MSSASARHCAKSGASPSEEEEDNAPIKYSTSKAREHSPFDTFLTRRKGPAYQPYIVIASMTVFLVYFLMLREENDMDEELDRSLFDKIPTLKDQTILAEIHKAKAAGRDVTQLELQLKQLRIATTTAAAASQTK